MSEWIKKLPRVPESMSRKEGLQEVFELATSSIGITSGG